MAPLIYFSCHAATHQLGDARNGDQPTSPITWHDGRWAYCPAGAWEGHEWRNVVPPSSLDELRRAAKREAAS
jgi:hypothetical protein